MLLQTNWVIPIDSYTSNPIEAIRRLIRTPTGIADTLRVALAARQLELKENLEKYEASHLKAVLKDHGLKLSNPDSTINHLVEKAPEKLLERTSESSKTLRLTDAGRAQIDALIYP